MGILSKLGHIPLSYKKNTINQEIWEEKIGTRNKNLKRLKTQCKILKK